MPQPEDRPKSAHVRRRHLLDRASQLSVTRYVAFALTGIGSLYAFALFVLIGSDAIVGNTIENARVILLCVHAAYFVVGGLLLVGLVMLLTHRFAGPARVMQDAVEAMRKGDYDARLNLRRHDYHKSLAAQLALLQHELSERQRTHDQLVRRIDLAIESGDVTDLHELTASMQPASAL